MHEMLYSSSALGVEKQLACSPQILQMQSALAIIDLAMTSLSASTFISSWTLLIVSFT
jgi:hypothetical protein